MAWCSYFHKSGSIRLMTPEAEQTKHKHISPTCSNKNVSFYPQIFNILEKGNLYILYKKISSYLREKM
jgi:hypothetical protein